jgi:hypothetical protein
MHIGKKILRTAALTCTLALAHAKPALAGDFDGVWTVSELPGHYYMVRENNGMLLLVHLGDDWEAFLGALAGSTATVTTLIANVNLSATVQFSSTSRATVHVTSCTPVSSAHYCAMPTGTTAVATKIF